MGLLDGLFYGESGGGLLDFLRNNAMNQQFSSGLPTDQAQYGSPVVPAAQVRPATFQPNQPSPPNAQMALSQASMPQSVPQQPTAPAFPGSESSGPGFGDRLMAGFQNFANAGGPLQALAGGISGLATGARNDPQSLAQQTMRAQYESLVPILGPQKAYAAVLNPKFAEAMSDQLKYHQPQSLGEGYFLPYGSNKPVRLYEPDKTPDVVKQYEYYKENLPAGEKAMPFDVWSTAKARAGATNIANNIDMNSGQTYDKQLAEGLGKSHAALANGVEDAQIRARDIAAMQGAVDAIQKNGGTTGGLAPNQSLQLQKTINAGAAALGIDKPFSEADLSDKEFLIKFNRSMAGAQAKGAVGARVTNFEMSNFLKANPGLDMTVTGNQRLLGIQAQIEERNIAVGNSIRDATAAAISEGKKINPVEVQTIIKSYDDSHHIKDPITGQDLTQSYVLPEFQNTPTNKSMATQHEESIQSMEKKIGNKTYFKGKDGEWYVK